MNAYELSDKLIELYCYREHIVDAVIMLRHQADLIALFEKQLKQTQK